MDEHQLSHVQDTLIIQMALLDAGIEASMSECYEMWCDFSETMAAGWMGLPDDTAELLSILEPRVEKRLGDSDA